MANFFGIQFENSLLIDFYSFMNIEVFLSTVNFQISIIKIPSVFEKQ